MLVNFRTRECVRELAPHICRSDHLESNRSVRWISIQAQWLCKGVSRPGGGCGGASSSAQVIQDNVLQLRIFTWHPLLSHAPATSRPYSLAPFRPTCSPTISNTSSVISISSLYHKHSHHDLNHFCAFSTCYVRCIPLLSSVCPNPLHPSKLSQSLHSSFM